jgi:hypothetical protein
MHEPNKEQWSKIIPMNSMPNFSYTLCVFADSVKK